MTDNKETYREEARHLLNIIKACDWQKAKCLKELGELEKKHGLVIDRENYKVLN